MIISIIVLSSVIQLTIKYFRYPSEIKMLTKNNNEDYNYPLITLNIVIHNFKPDKIVYANWNDYLSGDESNMGKERSNQARETGLDKIYRNFKGIINICLIYFYL